MAFIYPLCSSSKGNCTYIGDHHQGVLIDAGIGIRNFAAHLSMIGLEKQAIQGIFITHEHSDHVKGLSRLQKELNVPVYATRGTLSTLLEKGIALLEGEFRVLDGGTATLAGMEVTAFSTPHDSVQSQTYSVKTADDKKITVCTDLGYVTEEVHQNLLGSDILLLESNYEKSLLEIGIYPAFLKKRIAGKHGHLSNEDAAAEIVRLLKSGVHNFLLGHLSEENNRPELAFTNVVSELGKLGARVQDDYNLYVAPKNNTGNVIEIR